MDWYVRNNAFGGIEMVMSGVPLPGYTTIPRDAAKALIGAPIGTTLDAKMNHVPPVPPTGDFAAFIVRQKANRDARRRKK